MDLAEISPDVNNFAGKCWDLGSVRFLQVLERKPASRPAVFGFWRLRPAADHRNSLVGRFWIGRRSDPPGGSGLRWVWTGLVQIDASNIGYGGILLQHVSPTSPEQIVCFHSEIWTPTQLNYSIINFFFFFLSIVLCISKFQSGLLNQNFLIKIDCKFAKHVLEKDVQNIASKQIFAR